MAGVVIVGDCDTFARRCQTFHRLRQAEVQHLHRAVGPKLDVCGFEIAVNDPVLVRGLQGVGDLPCDGQRLVQRDRAAAQPLRQILTFDELHDEGVHAVRILEAVNVRDVRMVEGGEYLRLALKACEPVGVVRKQIRKDFDRDVAIELRVACAIDLAHSACADRRDDFVRAETSAGNKGHGTPDQPEALIVLARTSQ